MGHVRHNADRRVRLADVRRQQALRLLDRLLAFAVGPEFTGLIRIECPAKEGTLGRWKTTVEQYEPPDLEPADTT